MTIVAILCCLFYLFVAGGLYSFLRSDEEVARWEAFTVAALWPAILMLAILYAVLR